MSSPFAISLKKINDNEMGAFEESDNLKSAASKKKHSFDFTYGQVFCDLEWSTVKNEWKNAQEISFTMTQKSSATSAGQRRDPASSPMDL